MTKYVGTISAIVTIEEADIKKFFEIMNDAREALENVGYDYGACEVEMSQEVQDDN